VTVGRWLPPAADRSVLARVICRGEGGRVDVVGCCLRLLASVHGLIQVVLVHLWWVAGASGGPLLSELGLGNGLGYGSTVLGSSELDLVAVESHHV
jgi:hypothetical protein